MSYNSPADFRALALPSAALSGIVDADIQKFLDQGFGVVNGYLRGRYALPLDAPAPAEICAAELAIAAYNLLTWLGFNPEAYDANFRLKYEDTMRWLRDLAKGMVNLAITADATDTIVEGGAVVGSGDTRGWGDAGNGVAGSSGQVGEPIGNFWGNVPSS